jgi:hypothetical protein
MTMRRRDFAKEEKKTRGYYNEGQCKPSTSIKIMEETIITA